MIFVPFKVRIINPFHFFIIFKIFCNRKRIGTMTWHTKVKGFKSEVK